MDYTKTNDNNRDEVIILDQDAQRALAYLSGIPSTTDQSVIETVTDVSSKEQAQFHALINTWLHLQADEIREIGQTLLEVLKQLDLSNKKIRFRLESPQYLKLVRKSFRNWSTAESELKRRLMTNLLVNASIRTSSPDFVISMFIDWLDKYSDEHFRIIENLYHVDPKGLTRYQIWHQTYPYQPGEDSAEADLFRMLILDLTTGHIIRQERGKDYHGNFMRTVAKKDEVTHTTASPTFDNTKKYVLTELGKQFVTYAMQHEE